MKPAKQRERIRRNTVLIAAAMLASALQAGTPPDGSAATVTAGSGSFGNAEAHSNAEDQCERLIDVSYKEFAVLYKNKENPVIQAFSLYGELALQWATGDSNRGAYGSRDLPPLNDFPSSLWDDIDARRWRLGARAQLFDGFKFTGIIDVNPNVDPFYRDIYELYITYAPAETFNFSVGKRKAHFFSQEYNTPSRELIVFEQSLVTGLLIPRELTGAWINGSLREWTYVLAAYAGDYQTDFANFDAGAVIQANIGFDLSSVLHADKALVRFDYQGSTSGENSNGPQRFTNAFSLNSVYQQGRFYGYTDLLGGIGRGSQGDVVGITLTPTYFLVRNKLQAVLRYQYAHGENDGLGLQTRYEALAPDLVGTRGVGSSYNALYLGLNYYVHRHNFKVMTGVEYHDLTGGRKDFSGWTYLAGVRLSF